MLYTPVVKRLRLPAIFIAALFMLSVPFSPTTRAHTAPPSMRLHPLFPRQSQHSAAASTTYCQTITPCNPPMILNQGGSIQSNLVQHHPKLHLIFWGNWSSSEVASIQQFFQELAGTDYNNLLTQYYDATDFVHNDVRVVQAITDTGPYPGTLSATVIGNYISAKGYILSTSTLDDNYMVFTDSTAIYGTQDSGDCGFHELFGTIVMSVVRTDDSTSSLCKSSAPPIDGAAHEYAEAATDPQSPTGWATAAQNGKTAEIGDLCAENTVQLPITDPIGNYYTVEELWDNGANTCSDHETYTWNVTLENKDPAAISSIWGPFSRDFVGRNADGRLEAFALLNGVIEHRYQTCAGCTWSSWSSLGWSALDTPQVGMNRDGRLEVFALCAGRNICHSWQYAPNRGWHSWVPVQNGTFSFNSSPTVFQWPNGRLELFAVNGNDNNTVWHTWQTAPNGDWSGWVRLVSTSDQFFAGIGASQDIHGNPELFAFDFSNSIVFSYWTGSAWTSWTKLQNNGRTFLSPPTVGFNPPESGNAGRIRGWLEVFAVGSDGNVWHNYETDPPNHTWSGWSILPPTAQQAFDFPAPIVGYNRFEPEAGNAMLDVFALNGSNSLTVMHNFQEPVNGSLNWSGWSPVGSGTLSVQTRLFTVVNDRDGREEAFAYDGTSMHLAFQNASGVWQGWSSF